MSKRFSDVYMLVVFRSILSTTEGLHKYLQKKDVDLAQAILYKDAILETLKSMRNDEMTENIYKEAKAISEANNQSETSTVHRRKERRLEGYMVESFPYHPVCFELTRRFCGVSAELMKGIQAAADDFLSEDSLLLIAKDYKITVSKEEIMVAKQLLTRRRRCHFGHGKRLQAP